MCVLALGHAHRPKEHRNMRLAQTKHCHLKLLYVGFVVSVPSVLFLCCPSTSVSRVSLKVSV